MKPKSYRNTKFLNDQVNKYGSTELYCPVLECMERIWVTFCLEIIVNLDEAGDERPIGAEGDIRYQLRARKHNLSTLLLKIAGHNPKYLMGLKAKFHLRQLYQVLE
jgi:hypothetical protein